jgi:hypothetical protein
MNFDVKKQQVADELQRLELLGPTGWTEFELLPLNQLVVEFLKLDDLKSRTLSYLADLSEYAEDSAYRYDQRQYNHWEQRINEAIGKIEDLEDPTDEKRDAAAEMLRAELRTVQDHVASYHASWAKGSAILRSLTLLGIMAIPLLFLMALLPFLHPGPATQRILTNLNWGILGIVGSLSTVLLALQRSDFLEVGNTEGRRQLSRTVIGSTLGFLAGVLAFSLITGGALKGSIMPELTCGSALKPLQPKDLGLSIIWAIGAGMGFEWILDRVRTTTTGS